MAEFKENKKDDPRDPDLMQKEETPEAEETAKEQETQETQETPEAEEEKKENGTSELEKQLAEKEKKISEQEDRFKRLFAEFDNFRKRSESEKSGMYAEGEKAVLEKVLPLIDNFDRALASVPEDLKGNAYVDGMEKVYRSFMDALAAFGVKPIEAVGQNFDANFHNAVMHVEDEEAGENMVVEEFQKGYMFKDKVLRYSMVKVAN